MAKIINLNRARKQAQRAQRAAEAQVNRVRHGRTLHDKQAAQQVRDTENRQHEGHRLELRSPASEPHDD